MANEIERRYINVSSVRAIQGPKPTITGYAAVFNELSEDLGGFREQIEKGAFQDTIRNDDIRALWNHNSDKPLGRSKSGTLRLREDQKGLFATIHPPDTPTARDYIKSIERGDVTQMSFGFKTLKDTWGQDIEGKPVRTLQKIKLLDVSPVTFPAYPQTSVAVRSKVKALTEKVTHRGLGEQVTVRGDNSQVRLASMRLRQWMLEEQIMFEDELAKGGEYGQD